MSNTVYTRIKAQASESLNNLKLQVELIGGYLKNEAAMRKFDRAISEMQWEHANPFRDATDAPPSPLAAKVKSGVWKTLKLSALGAALLSTYAAGEYIGQGNDISNAPQDAINWVKEQEFFKSDKAQHFTSNEDDICNSVKSIINYDPSCVSAPPSPEELNAIEPG